MSALASRAGKLKNLRVEWLDLDELRKLRPLDVNARFMRHEQFARLVENVRRDGQLTSTPFAWREGKAKTTASYLVLSGNHRIRAAIEAEIPGAFVMLCDDPMPKDRRTALQIAHNAIAGEDDPATLAELYDSMEDVDWRVYSGVDDKTLQLLENVQPGSLSEASLEFQTITVTFLPDEQERAERAWDLAKQELIGTDGVWLARLDDAVRTLDALDVAGRSYGVTNVATSLAVVLDVFETHVTDLREGYLGADGEAIEQKRWVPVATVTGHEIPSGAAATVNRAIARMVERGDASHAWQALEFLAAEYLAGD